jgi:hypothetical protein
VATQRNHLVTLDPDNGNVRWSLSRAQPVRDPRWSGGGLDTRIAYRAGSSLHVVAGDGSPDAVIAPNVAPVAPAWRGETHTLAYATPDDRVHVLDADARRTLWTTPVIPDVRRLAFDPTGRLVVETGREALLYGKKGLIARSPDLLAGHVLLDAVALSEGRIVYADYDPKTNRTRLVLAHCFAPGRCLLIGPSEFFRGAGRVSDFTLSPDGRWLAAGWPAADQFLFLRTARINRVEAISNITCEFYGCPFPITVPEFPRLLAWAPNAS